MKKISRRQFIKTVRAAAVTGALAMAGTGQALTASACIAPSAPAEGFDQTVVIEGCPWGPAVTATIVELEQLVRAGSVRAEDFVVTERKESFDWATFSPVHVVSGGSARTVTSAVTCTKRGVPVNAPSRYIRLELAYGPSEGSPFCYDVYTAKNTWCDPYSLEVKLAEGASLTSLTGQPVKELKVNPLIDRSAAQIPELDAFDTTGEFTGSDGKTLYYASYQPPLLRGSRLPLVIWLHGAGEGGADPSVLLLGNEVTPLAESEFQAAMGGGAYILTPQTPGFWLEYDENGNWDDNPGVASIYTQTLMELIEHFVQENPRIDPNRILIGGCSNGGYMAVNMVLRYPDYFAAAYPICEAYEDAGITDAELESIKDLPIWFVFAQNDTTVIPETHEIPTLARLRAIGASPRTSIFADVHDTTGRYQAADGGPYQYSGHWSWVYFFQNQCVDDATGENMWDWLGRQSK